jgi:hypothetical protein
MHASAANGYADPSTLLALGETAHFGEPDGPKLLAEQVTRLDALRVTAREKSL